MCGLSVSSAGQDQYRPFHQRNSCVPVGHQPNDGGGPECFSLNCWLIGSDGDGDAILFSLVQPLQQRGFASRKLMHRQRNALVATQGLLVKLLTHVRLGGGLACVIRCGLRAISGSECGFAKHNL